MWSTMDVAEWSVWPGYADDKVKQTVSRVSMEKGVSRTVTEHTEQSDLNWQSITEVETNSNKI